MPRYLVPHRTGAHRIAVFALYRALLSQCIAAPLADEQRNAARNIVRNTFRRNVKLQGPRLLEKAFNAGYMTLDYLDTSISGDESSKESLLDLLAKSPAHMAAAPALPIPKKKNPPFTERTTRSILDRPRPLSELSGGKRLIPILVSANRIPILRFKKPQSTILSMYIKRRVKTRQARHTRKEVAEEMLELAKAEDRWDGILRTKGLIGHDQDVAVNEQRIQGIRESKWRDEPQSALGEVLGLLEEEGHRNAAWAKLMVEIVDKEKALAERERKDRVMKKNNERRMRKAARDAEAGVVLGGKETNVSDDQPQTDARGDDETSKSPQSVVWKPLV